MSFDLRPWLRGGRFILTAVRRRWLIVSALVALFTGAAAGASLLLPRSYSGETRILAKRNYNMSAIAAPRRAVPPSAEAPAGSAAELILQHDALLAIVRQARLAERWESTAPPLSRWKQALRERMKGPLGPEEIEEAILGMLRQRIQVGVDQNEVIMIRVRWWDPDDVLAILNASVQGFLAARERLDVETIEETAAILERTAEEVRVSLEQRLEDFRLARARAVDGTVARVSTTRSTAAEVQELRAELQARQRFRQELERQRNMRISDLQLQIAERSATLAERHPDQIAARDALGLLLEDDGGVAQARALEEELERSISHLGGDASELVGTAAGSDFLESGVSPDEDASVIYARTLLRIDADDYQDMVTRLKNARVELEAARAAFPFRYSVTRPAERPRKPDSPNVPLVLVGGLLAGLSSGVLAALFLQLRAHLAQLLKEQLA